MPSQSRLRLTLKTATDNTFSGLKSKQASKAQKMCTECQGLEMTFTKVDDFNTECQGLR